MEHVSDKEKTNNYKEKSSSRERHRLSRGSGSRHLCANRRTCETFKETQKGQSLQEGSYQDGSRQAHTFEILGANQQTSLQRPHEEDGSRVVFEFSDNFSLYATI